MVDAYVGEEACGDKGLERLIFLLGAQSTTRARLEI
jgi:hypothetical protein